jgi:Tfp pilus assembly protein PilF
MWMKALVFAVALGSVPGLALADARNDAKEQVKFGIAVAQRVVARRFIDGARQLDPTYAAAHNNLAIARPESWANRGAYEKAMELEPDNALIKQNYELFREINDRTTRKDAQ